MVVLRNPHVQQDRDMNRASSADPRQISRAQVARIVPAKTQSRWLARLWEFQGRGEGKDKAIAAAEYPLVGQEGGSCMAVCRNHGLAYHSAGNFNHLHSLLLTRG